MVYFSMNSIETFPHTIPKDLSTALNSNPKVKKIWNDITPLARNEFICWIISAKKEDTRLHRIKRLSEELLEGKRRPCCWAGCSHRK